MTHHQPGISQTVVAGTLGTPSVFSGLLIVTVFLLGIEIALLFVMRFEMSKMEKEVRILGLQVQDQTAVMIREGVMKPEDQTMGPTNPANKATEKKP